MRSDGQWLSTDVWLLIVNLCVYIFARQEYYQLTDCYRVVVELAEVVEHAHARGEERGADLPGAASRGAHARVQRT